MSCGYDCEYSCEECDVPDKVNEFVKGYNQALDDFYNGLADELLWIRERFGDDVYMEVRCFAGCLQNKLTK